MHTLTIKLAKVLAFTTNASTNIFAVNWEGMIALRAKRSIERSVSCGSLLSSRCNAIGTKEIVPLNMWEEWQEAIRIRFDLIRRKQVAHLLTLQVPLINSFNLLGGKVIKRAEILLILNGTRLRRREDVFVSANRAH
jgi:hypothetical protein